MAREHIPDDVRRFILTSIPSVPYLEAMLLLRSEPGHPWDSKRVAQRLYMPEKASGELLSELHTAGVLAVAEEHVPSYCYHPISEDLHLIIDRLAATYAAHLIDVSNLIHSKTGKKAQHFADAFKWRKDS